jgi:dTDP-4-dehydrorhamnose reductase
MLRLMAELDVLGVVNDQIVSPTDSLGLAEVLWELAATNLKGQCTQSESIPPGIYHWSDAGAISRHDFALDIQRLALQLGLLKKAIPINPIGTADYPTPARRSAYSVLDCSGLVATLNKPQTGWQLNLQRVISCLAAGTNIELSQ